MTGSRAVLVLGMHRSGTSALAGALARLGVPLGRRMVDAAPDNPSGYWENAAAVTADERLLLALGRGWDDLRGLPADWLASSAALEARQAIEALVESEFSWLPLWAVKDPRLCRLLPVWLEVLAHRGIEPLCLFMVRSPAEVAASLEHRDGLPREHALLLWAQHLLMAERDSRGCRRTLLSYDGLLSDPVASLGKVAEDFSVEWPFPPDRAGLRDVLREEQRHHRHAGGAMAGPLGEMIESLAAACRDIERGDDAWPRIAAWGGGLDAAIHSWLPSAAGWARALNRSRTRLSECDERLERTESALRTASEMALERLMTIESQSRKLDEVHAALEAVKAQSLERLATIESQSRKLDEVHAALEAVKTQSLERLATIESQSRKLDEVHAALEAVKTQSLERLATIESQSRKLDEVHAALEAVKTQSLERLATIESQSREIDALQQQFAEQCRRTALLNEELSSVYSSRSWRFTAPLRYLADLLRRLLGGGR